MAPTSAIRFEGKQVPRLVCHRRRRRLPLELPLSRVAPAYELAWAPRSWGCWDRFRRVPVITVVTTALGDVWLSTRLLACGTWLQLRHAAPGENRSVYVSFYGLRKIRHIARSLDSITCSGAAAVAVRFWLLHSGRFRDPPHPSLFRPWNKSGERCGIITSGIATASTSSTITTIRAGLRCKTPPTMTLGAGGIARLATSAGGAAAGDRSHAGADSAEATAATATAKAAGRSLRTLWSSRAVRRRRGPGGLAGPAVGAAGAGGGGGSDRDSVMDKKAEFYGNSAPGAVAPEGAEKQDKAAVEYAVAGEREKSLKLIEAMRDSNFVPSVNAYVATIEACRRANEYDRASALYSEMNEVCLPEDLIKEYAAKHPNAPGVTQTQKVFCLAMMMRQDNIEPFEETYRAIMGLASKEKLWQVSLLLVEHLKRTGLVPGKFVYDEICSVLFKTGHPEMATMVFEDAVRDNVDELNSFSKPKLDLHNHTVSTALAAVRVVLLDMARQPKSRPFHDPAQELLIITGMGNNSKDGEAVIKPRVMELLEDMGLEPSMMRNNEGCIVLKPADLQAYTARVVPA